MYFCFSRTSRSWWITQSTQHHRRGCNSWKWKTICNMENNLQYCYVRLSLYITKCRKEDWLECYEDYNQIVVPIYSSSRWWNGNYIFSKGNATPTCRLQTRWFAWHAFCSRGDWGDRPTLKFTTLFTMKVTLFTMILYNPQKSIRDIRQFCRPLFCRSSVVKYTSLLLP